MWAMRVAWRARAADVFLDEDPADRADEDEEDADDEDDLAGEDDVLHAVQPLAH